jgi:ring-1,2-phenylacetyl-CoA epoxidase subunit PaaD
MGRRTADDATPVIRRTPESVVPVARMVPAYEVAAGTPDPEIPTLTIEDLGILRSVDYSPGAGIVVKITPTYSGCPAMREIAADVQARLNRAGFERVVIETQLAPAWSTDWITAEGHRKLAEVGIAPPHPAPAAARGVPVPLTLGRRPEPHRCPRCGSYETRLTAQFSATACKSLHRCEACAEPFEAVKAI